MFFFLKYRRVCDDLLLRKIFDICFFLYVLFVMILFDCYGFLLLFFFLEKEVQKHRTQKKKKKKKKKPGSWTSSSSSKTSPSRSTWLPGPPSLNGWGCSESVTWNKSLDVSIVFHFFFVCFAFYLFRFFWRFSVFCSVFCFWLNILRIESWQNITCHKYYWKQKQKIKKKKKEMKMD